MNEKIFFNFLILAWFIIGIITFIALFFISAPYGRHVTPRHWGLTIKSRTGWIVMESIAPLIMAFCFLIGTNRITLPEIIFLLLWEAHYIHRAYIYPLHRRDGDKPMPLMVISLGFIFNAVNGYLNGRYIFTLSPGYENTWLTDPRFIAGAALFIIGFIINRQSDQILRSLRRPGESGYRIANTGLYRWISSPNYLGEMIIWSGWALATWSPAGLAFAFWTAANLLPRARANHLWYRKQFPDYPSDRKALIPKIW
jgi:3-oxo-5-alpha-steroid 4-dehydrogenase 1